MDARRTCVTTMGMAALVVWLAGPLAGQTIIKLDPNAPRVAGPVERIEHPDEEALDEQDAAGAVQPGDAAVQSELERSHSSFYDDAPLNLDTPVSAEVVARPEDDWYEMSRGVYVRPAPYSPTYWSPRMRLMRPYDRTARNPRHGVDRGYRGSYSHHRHFRHYERGYDDWYGYDRYSSDLQEAYELGREDADRDYVWFIASERAGRLLNQYKKEFDEGILLFRKGQYERAAVNWLGAAERNHASAPARLHAGHALFALGQYSGAAELITRAFELAPSLTYKHYDMRDEYGNTADFDTQLAALKTFVGQHPNDAGAVTLLGYALFYTEGPSAAKDALERAAKLDPESLFIPKLLKVARQTSPDPRLEQSPTPKKKADEPAAEEPRKETARRSSSSSGYVRVVRWTPMR